jgi:hypothetical protein
MKEFQVSQIDAMVKTVKKFAQKAGYTVNVDRDNIGEVVKTLASKYTESFAEELQRGYDLAVRQHALYESPATKHFEENYHLISDNLDNILSLLDIDTDYPGLYPTFELDRNGEHFTMHGTLSALRQYNNYWNHW